MLINYVYSANNKHSVAVETLLGGLGVIKSPLEYCFDTKVVLSSPIIRIYERIKIRGGGVVSWRTGFCYF